LHQGINDCACASQALISRLDSFEFLIKLNPTHFVSGILKMGSGADRQAILLKAVETMIADKARLIRSLQTEVNVLVLCIECSSLRVEVIDVFESDYFTFHSTILIAVRSPVHDKITSPQSLC
jgi:hypothetical protein